MDSRDKERTLETGPVSIEWIDADPSPPCVVCGWEVGKGPVGFKKGDPSGPLCDPCLVKSNLDLGLLLWLAHLVRMAGDITTANEDLTDLCAAPLMMFARIYNRRARWPDRIPPPAGDGKPPLEAILRYLKDPAN